MDFFFFSIYVCMYNTFKKDFSIVLISEEH